jgi:hypothetical protein
MSCPWYKKIHSCTAATKSRVFPKVNMMYVNGDFFLKMKWTRRDFQAGNAGHQLFEPEAPYVQGRCSLLLRTSLCSRKVPG